MLLDIIEKFFEQAGWNMLVPHVQQATETKSNSLKTNLFLIDHADIVIVEASSKRKEMRWLYETALSKNKKILVIFNKRNGISEVMADVVSVGFGYTQASEIVKWLGGMDDFQSLGFRKN